MKILIIYNSILFLIGKIYASILEWKIFFILWVMFISIVIYFDLFEESDGIGIYEKYKRVTLSFVAVCCFYVVVGILYTIVDIIRYPSIRKALSSRHFSPFSAASSGQRKVK